MERNFIEEWEENCWRILGWDNQSSASSDPLVHLVQQDITAKPDSDDLRTSFASTASDTFGWVKRSAGKVVTGVKSTYEAIKAIGEMHNN